MNISESVAEVIAATSVTAEEAAMNVQLSMRRIDEARQGTAHLSKS